MVNPYLGEVSLVIDGAPQTLRLTLGRLAVLEQALGEDSLVALVERFETGRFAARDLLALLAAGLGVEASALADAEIEGGAVEAARVAAQLLKLTFQMPEGA